MGIRQKKDIAVRPTPLGSLLPLSVFLVAFACGRRSLRAKRWGAAWGASCTPSVKWRATRSCHGSLILHLWGWIREWSTWGAREPVHASAQQGTGSREVPGRRFSTQSDGGAFGGVEQCLLFAKTVKPGGWPREAGTRRGPPCAANGGGGLSSGNPAFSEECINEWPATGVRPETCPLVFDLIACDLFFLRGGQAVGSCTLVLRFHGLPWNG